eukprot:6181552-Pleurochrysis_carterae.AAC.2
MPTQDFPMTTDQTPGNGAHDRRKRCIGTWARPGLSMIWLGEVNNKIQKHAWIITETILFAARRTSFSKLRSRPR